MKAITFFIALALPLIISAQNTRYFEVGLRLNFSEPGTDWRDSSFIIAASDPALLALADAELALPVSERQLNVSGALAGGNGGFNHNGQFWYSWHVPQNNWTLVEFSIELCDGRPYSDVEQDTGYWIGTVGRYCSWASYLKREVAPPAVPVHDVVPEPVMTFGIYPNPAGSEAFFTWEMPESGEASLTLADLNGKLSLTVYLGQIDRGPFTKSLSTGALDRGLYNAILRVNGKSVSRKFVLQ